MLVSGVFTRRIRSHVHFDVDIIPGNDLLSANGTNLDLHVDDAKRLGTDIDLNKSWVDRLVKLSKSGNKTDGAWGL